MEPTLAVHWHDDERETWSGTLCIEFAQIKRERFRLRPIFSVVKVVLCVCVSVCGTMTMGWSLTFIYYISQSISMHITMYRKEEKKNTQTHCALPVFLNDFHVSSFCFLSFSFFRSVVRPLAMLLDRIGCLHFACSYSPI